MRYEERVEERTRIAQELHDHLIQEMVGIGMQLEVIDELTPEDTGAKRPVERALALSRSAIASGRLTLQTLRTRPVSGSAFIETLRRTAEAYPEKERVQYVVEGEERMLHPEIAEDLSEVGQEALRNALKHAGAGSITVRLHYGLRSLELRVRDHGAGITDDVLRTGVSGHYGLAGMRERAARMSAEFAIHRTPGQGTTVYVSVPGARAYQDDPDSTTSRLGRIFRWSRASSRQEKGK
jgi:signal transduction histidine kinase